MKLPSPYLIGGAAVAAALAYVALRGTKEAATDLGAAVGGAAVDLVDGALGGVIGTIGEGFGIPKTNLTECERAKLEGRTWDASFACPAGDFIGYLWK